MGPLLKLQRQGGESEVSNDDSVDEELSLEDDDEDDVGDGSKVDHAESDDDDNEREIMKEIHEMMDPSLKRKAVDELVMKSKKKKKIDQIKPPTAEEMMNLMETENLYKSNLFKLQTEEMLSELKTKKSVIKLIKSWIGQFEDYLDEVEIPEISDDWLKSCGVLLPVKHYFKEMSIKKFIKPASILPMGAYSSGTLMGHCLNIDVGVVIPKKFFLKTDKLDKKYHHKKSWYLAILAHILKGSPLINPDSPLEYSFAAGDHLKPVLLITPPGKICGFVKFMIHPVPEEGTFKESKFAPHLNNIRHLNIKEGTKKELLPTPFYNASILEDLFIHKSEKLCEEFKEMKSIKEAIIMLKVWLKQRELSEGYGSFSNFILIMYVIHLLKRKLIRPIMSTYQIIRFAWLHLAQSDWEKAGLMMGNSDLPFDVRQSFKAFDVVFMDPTGTFNIASRLNKFVYRQVVREASLALKYLDTPSLNSFLPLFMVKMPFLQQFDGVICFNYFAPILNQIKTNHPSELKQRGIIEVFWKMVSDLLHKGLGTRLQSMSVACPIPPVWPVTMKQPSRPPFVFGLMLNPETAFNFIEKGPDANTPEAEEFKEFWDNKCETRRFRDGTICEAVAWSKDRTTIHERRTVVFKIVEFLFSKYLGLALGNYIFVLDNFRNLMLNRSGKIKSMEEASQKVHEVYQELSQDLRKLNDLPLDIVSVRCISPVYRFTDISPPQPAIKDKQKLDMAKLTENVSLNSIPRYVSPIDVVIRLSISSKWPDDVATGRRLVAAFNIAIANSLKSSRKLETQVTSEYVLVLKDGYVFRIFLGYEKEIALIKKQVSDKGIICYRDSPESIYIEKRFISLPKLTGALYGVSQQYGPFGASACLAKYWMASQLIDDSHFPYVIVDLLIARLFVSPEPFTPPNMPLVAFLRFLSMLSSTNWQTEPVIINFNNLLSGKDIADFEKNFNNNRSSLPSLLVMTPYDPSGTLWTKEVPTLQTLIRLAKLASASLKILEICLPSSTSRENLMRVFHHPMSVYDLIIKLIEERSKKRESYRQEYVDKIPVVDFKPVDLYIKELRSHYSDIALFFFNPNNADQIGVVFKPGVFDKKDFKVSAINGRQAVIKSGSLKLKADLDCLVEDFKVLGQGLVDNIIVQNK